MIRICQACYIEYDDDFRAKECPHKLWTKRSLVERIEALEKDILELREKLIYAEPYEPWEKKDANTK